jgi:hypothetical protein
MYNKIFISYATEDVKTAEKLFDFLSIRGYEPWMDKKKVLPGQAWDTEIKTALKKANFVIILLSQTSVSKRGYIQREFKLALTHMEDKLETDIYLIPLKIDDCEIPDNLQKYQWTELKKSNSFEIISEAIELQRKIYITNDKKKEGTESLFKYEAIKEESHIKGQPSLSIENIYPHFSITTDNTFKEINTIIHSEIINHTCWFNKMYGGVLYNNKDDSDYRYEAHTNFNIVYVNTNFISYKLFFYHYSGGAHGLYGNKGYTYRLNPLIPITINDLLDNDDDVLKFVTKYCRDYLIARAENDFGLEKGIDFFIDKKSLTKSNWDEISNFYLTKDSVVIIFGIYQIATYAAGESEVIIPFKVLLNQFKSNSTFKSIIDLMK